METMTADDRAADDGTRMMMIRIERGRASDTVVRRLGRRHEVMIGSSPMRSGYALIGPRGVRGMMFNQ